MMTTATGTTRRRIRAADVLLAPLRWLERARGWRRRLLVLVYLMVLATLALFAWRATSLNRLPAVGEPFDVRAFRAEAAVPESDDAFVLYRRAVGKIRPSREAQDWGAVFMAARNGWGKAPLGLRWWIISNREALDLWLEGTKRPDAHPEPLASSRDPLAWFELDLHPYQDLGALALIEGSRLESEGDRAGALRWYLAAARYERHLSLRSRLNWRSLAGYLDGLLRDRMIAWSSDPQIDPALLREAIAGLTAPEAAPPPISDNLKADYLARRAAISDLMTLNRRLEGSGGITYTYDQFGHWLRLYWFLRREPERSLRVLDLAFADWLAQCDRPRSKRAAWTGNHPQSPIWGFYDDDPSAPPSANAIGAQDLFAWLESTALLWRIFPMYPPLAPDLTNERQSRGVLLVLLAERLYLRETGHEVPSAEALVPKYLKVLPEEYEEMEAAKP